MQLLIAVLLGFTVPLIIASISSQQFNVASLNKEWWNVNNLSNSTAFKALRGQSMYVRRVDLDEEHIHSCYEYRIFDTEGSLTKVNTFCYPLVIISGFPKCSTSALYALMSNYSKIVLLPHKEECFEDTRKFRSIVDFFDSLPNYIDRGRILLDGCIQLEQNLAMREILKGPNTFYMIITRNFADWAWSTYHYFCLEGEVSRCNNRTPERFNGLVTGQYESAKDVAKVTCTAAHKKYRAKINQLLWGKAGVAVEDTLILSSEVLEDNPSYVWSQIAYSIGLEIGENKLLDNFGSTRYNTQIHGKPDGLKKGVPVEEYQHGLYFSSNFQPMWNATVDQLNKCWEADCIWLSALTGHNYDACRAPDVLKGWTVDDIPNFSDTGYPLQRQCFNRYVENRHTFENAMVSSDRAQSFLFRVRARRRQGTPLVAKKASEVVEQLLAETNQYLVRYRKDDAMLNYEEQCSYYTNRPLVYNSLSPPRIPVGENDVALPIRSGHPPPVGLVAAQSAQSFFARLLLGLASGHGSGTLVPSSKANAKLLHPLINSQDCKSNHTVVFIDIKKAEIVELEGAGPGRGRGTGRGRGRGGRLESGVRGDARGGVDGDNRGRMFVTGRETSINSHVKSISQPNRVNCRFLPLTRNIALVRDPLFFLWKDIEANKLPTLSRSKQHRTNIYTLEETTAEIKRWIKTSLFPSSDYVALTTLALNLQSENLIFVSFEALMFPGRVMSAASARNVLSIKHADPVFNTALYQRSWILAELLLFANMKVENWHSLEYTFYRKEIKGYFAEGEGKTVLDELVGMKTFFDQLPMAKLCLINKVINEEVSILLKDIQFMRASPSMMDNSAQQC